MILNPDPERRSGGNPIISLNLEVHTFEIFDIAARISSANNISAAELGLSLVSDSCSFAKFAAKSFDLRHQRKSAATSVE